MTAPQHVKDEQGCGRCREWWRGGIDVIMAEGVSYAIVITCGRIHNRSRVDVRILQRSITARQVLVTSPTRVPWAPAHSVCPQIMMQCSLTHCIPPPPFHLALLMTDPLPLCEMRIPNEQVVREYINDEVIS